MEVPPENGTAACVWLGDSLRITERAAVCITIAAAFAVRLYLGLTSFCISGDGAGYLGMARKLAAGEWTKGFDAVFSPLYPLLIAGAHRLIPNWEIAGNMVSVVMGTGAVAAVYLMFREVFGRRDLALGAAALAAIHPDLAAYSASVRTEAGYLCLLAAASWLLLRGLNHRAIGVCAMAGAVGGLAYLYRSEGIGFPAVGVIFIAALALVWKTAPPRWALGAAAIFAAAFLAVASPYIIFLRAATGHWTIGREFTAAMMYGMGDFATKNRDQWRHLGFSAAASPFAPIFSDPRLYLTKVCGYFVASFYNFAQALGPILTVLLGAGLWTRGRRILAVPAEAFLAILVVFYFCGFSLSYTGTRFMVHLIPFTFGWIIAGLIAAMEALDRLAARFEWRLPHGLIPIAIALALLPKTLWPIGYDMRGVRYAGEDIARLSGGRGAVVARDGRVAYYAGAQFIGLPSRGVGDICAWLEARGGAGYLVIGNRDERRFAVSPAVPCLEFVKRYPRYGAGYYDLYAVRRPGAAAREEGDALR